jgi:tripartite-type tricarboxylate transporter receptor subunit TctC
MLHGPNRRMLLAAFAVSTLTPRAHAQQAKTIRLIVPFTAGSPNDVLARLLAQHWSARSGLGVIVDNRPGAGTTIGTKLAASAEPDGMTLLFQSSSMVVAPAMYKNLDFDPQKSFAPVANVAEGHWVTVVPPSLPVRTIGEFVAYAKANPGTLQFGFGQGTAPQLVGEWFKRLNNLDVGSVPYRGGAQAITDMLGGRIHLNIDTTATLVPLIKEGKLKAISVWSPKPLPDLPGIPTMIESGYPGLSLTFWAGIWAPAGTPTDVIAKLNADINAALGSAEVRESLRKLGVEPRPGSPQDFATFIADETPKWQNIVRASGVTVQ